MDKDCVPYSSESKEFQLEIFIESEKTLEEISEPTEHPYQPAVLALELVEDNSLNPVLNANKLITNTPSLNEWEPIERPLRQQSLDLPSLTMLEWHSSERGNTESSKDELLGVSDNRLLPAPGDFLTAPFQLSSASYDSTDYSYRFNVEQDVGGATKLDSSIIYAFGFTGLAFENDLLSKGFSSSQNILGLPRIDKFNELNGGENLYPPT
ncbi:hypothetical protein H6F93_01390 [Leptolyngbya sp. FACHB-671]|uniref:hypothetical protein n=1 Tax=Leptolyngbya sp. FACHB-671 TaxID=2692812 RepID=UPI001682EE26|nr:hypothetical protein [Leptolyngbya sp. FACHB-671]MBD2066193.1 hypothetical protein [Leptolyngbya sp. FACHB-671]